jgi:hypothetical protein
MKNKFIQLFLVPLFLLALIAVVSAKPGVDPPGAIIWKLKDTNLVGGYKPSIFGSPANKSDNSGSSLFFDGIDDGIVIPKIPIEGWERFTIEVLFKPDSDGPVEPRFIHFEDKELNRGTFEVRLKGNGQWYMDTFLKNGKTNKGLTLIDSSMLHSANKWYWVAMEYDGKKMSSYVNGQKELEGEVIFPAMTAGAISLGVRLNKVNWFKGSIREIRFHPTVLDRKELQHL